eukprot:CAMPEP_0117503016 /NCGR_PEP_ID=MMETSP0784-20121206/24109_1 /TAXON_ID=39447 /ORGANISM="" /LENGTH=98 /DNA_ID=CAMNT_0005298313 /DNA_START=177 /DNA_END=473 /DNA_ORIENTATION=-
MVDVADGAEVDVVLCVARHNRPLCPGDARALAGSGDEPRPCTGCRRKRRAGARVVTSTSQGHGARSQEAQGGTSEEQWCGVGRAEARRSRVAVLRRRA